ncbi:MAG: phage head closure protein [Lachnospiraceae bacterium]|jgi:SPP1 family predicted phage head-tail adaptor|nr:phage head closure protein [Lachnospiraceae bacterium]MCH4067220.1 phage head closure protein [Lachnospiraceae bacterium]MCH4113246.1 phage head closure protein [Lachnospiraceae bacterium]
MNIAAMNLRITFQKQVVETDEYGNHTNSTADYITCWATASGSGTETDAAGTTNSEESIDFTTRWCKALSEVTSDHYRIIADGKLYNILYVNPMGYKHNSLKFHCERVKR